MYKRAIFAQRLIENEESFGLVGAIPAERCPFAVLWHEALSERNQKDIISAFKSLLMHNIDV